MTLRRLSACLLLFVAALIQYTHATDRSIWTGIPRPGPDTFSNVAPTYVVPSSRAQTQIQSIVDQRPIVKQPNYNHYPAAADMLLEAGPSQGPAEHLQVAPIQQNAHNAKKADRAVRLKEYTFKLQTYPLDTAEFRHLYLSKAYVPSNVESRLVGNKLAVRGSVFRPEPELLKAIKNKLGHHLFGSHLPPKPINAQTPDVRQGDFLLPSVSPSRWIINGLDVKSSLMSKGVRASIRNRLKTHSAQTPKLYHMEVEVDGKARHVLAIPVRPEDYLGENNLPIDSDLWIFTESLDPVARQYASRPKLALLGGTFLPWTGKRSMLEAGLIRPAFPQLLELAHA